MSVSKALQQKIRLLTSLSILVWVSIFSTLGRAVRRSLTRLLWSIAPNLTTESGILAQSYHVMREQLRFSLQEVEQKRQKLEESEEEIRRSRDSLQTIIDSLDEELIVLDNQFHIIQANQRTYLEHGDREVIGRNCYEVTHGLNYPCRPPSCACPVSKVWQTGTPTRVVHIHNNQQGEKYVEVSASPMRNGQGKVTQVIELIRDITESKELEKRILEANRRLLALNAIASTASQSLGLDITLNSALDKVLELTGGEAGGILLFDEKSQTLSYRVYRGLSEEFARGTAGLALGEGIAGQVAQQGETLVVDDISKDPRASRRIMVAQEGIKAFIAVPLRAKEKLVGVLTIANRTARTFPEQQVQLLTASGHQLAIAIENAKLYQELQIKEQTRAELLRRIISAQEDERRRVARELHDVTSQALATLAVRLEGLPIPRGSNTKDVDIQLVEVKSLLSQTSKEVHRLIHDLRPSLLDDLGLLAALRSCAYGALHPAGVEVHLEVIGQERRLPSEVEIALFRIAQEAITNIVSHARAESACVSLEFRDKTVVLQVEDDGIGFNLSQVFDSTSGKENMGLIGMKERAELLGGTLAINTHPGRGTVVLAEIAVDRGEG